MIKANRFLYDDIPHIFFQSGQLVKKNFLTIFESLGLNRYNKYNKITRRILLWGSLRIADDAEECL